MFKKFLAQKIDTMTKRIFDAKKEQKDVSIKKNTLLRDREVYIKQLVDLSLKDNFKKEKQLQFSKKLENKNYKNKRW